MPNFGAANAKKRKHFFAEPTLEAREKEVYFSFFPSKPRLREQNKTNRSIEADVERCENIKRTILRDHERGSSPPQGIRDN